MNSSARVSRSNAAARRVPRRVPRQNHRLIEAMESRVLFHFTVHTPVPDQVVEPNATPTSVDLGQHIFDETAGPTVLITTTQGNIDVKLTERQTPVTVANFLNYVNTGRYNGTVIHRSEPGPPPFVIQGGGYVLGTDQEGDPVGTHITTDAPIVNEYSPSRPNLRGTIAMAKTSDPNSATSEWFVNLSNNTSLDNPSNSGGFTTFGTVSAAGMETVDDIAALRRANATPVNGAWNNLPVTNNSLPAHPTATTVTADDVVTVTNVSVSQPTPTVTYSIVSNSNPDVVTPTIGGSVLTFNYTAGATGVANIVVRATQSTGETVDETVTVTVNAPPPPEPFGVAVGQGAARTVTWTDADGTVGVITVAGGVATVRFNGTDLAQTTERAGSVVTGANVDVNSVTVTSGAPSIRVRATGGSDGRVVVNGITTGGTVRAFTGREVILRGNTNIGGGIGRLDVFRTEDATLTLAGMASAGGASITIGSAEDTDITSSSPIRTLRVGGWSNGAGDLDFDVITAPAIGSFQSGGDFGGDLTVNGASSARNLRSARVSGAITGGRWNVSGLTGNVAAESVAQAFQASFGGPVTGLAVGGDLSGTIAADSIRSVRASSITNATLTLTRTSGVALNSLNATGQIANSHVRSNGGDIGTVNAGGIADSTVFVGVNTEGAALPDSADDFTVTTGTIRSVNVRNRSTASFVNSDVAAANLGRMNLGVVTAVNGGVPFGVAGLTIASVNATDGTGAVIRLARLDDPIGGREFGDFKVRVF